MDVGMTDKKIGFVVLVTKPFLSLILIYFWCDYLPKTQPTRIPLLIAIGKSLGATINP